MNAKISRATIRHHSGATQSAVTYTLGLVRVAVLADGQMLRFVSTGKALAGKMWHAVSVSDEHANRMHIVRVEKALAEAEWADESAPLPVVRPTIQPMTSDIAALFGQSADLPALEFAL